ncbi:MAG: hypothetical protein E7429_06745 [Ruminococcaceae bacterium]|nr:hypothetical protein [Oscillospiraceae bacterium]MBE6996400.1 hypothetical protein [Oscillospiraceae bacterium]
MKKINEMEDMDVLKQMYATLCGGMDDALTLLEQGNVWDAKKTLLRSLETAEELYIDGMSAVDELAHLREFS